MDTWDLSASGRSVTITAVDDTCAARLAAIPGTWWKMGCKDPNDNCLGDLDAWTMKTQFFTPRVDPGEVSTAWYAALTYAVPDGWGEFGRFGRPRSS